MPDFATHFMLGEQVRQGLQGDTAQLVEQNLAAFYWGLQGPDPLFFHKIFTGGKRLPHYGHLMHAQKTADLMDACARYVYQSRHTPCYQINQSYFLGFLCHYVLDKTVHPYVFFRQGALRSQLPEQLWPALHYQIETEMDNQLYPLYYGQHILRFDPGKSYKLRPDFLRCAGGFYAAVLQEVYGVRVTSKEIAKAFRDALFVARLLYDSSGWVVYYLTKLVDALSGTPNIYCSHVKGRCSGADVLNLENANWHNPHTPEIIRCESVPQLIELARKETLAFGSLYMQMFASGQLEKLPFTESFSNGRLDN